MIFKSEEQLKAFLLPKLQNAVTEAENKIYADIKSTLAQFYGEFTPAEYIRTNQLLHSLVKSNIKKTANGYEAEVYFDASMLNYEHDHILRKGGWYGSARWDGGTVLDVAMESSVPHGGYATGTSVWSVSLEKIGDVLALLEQKLRAQGIPIKK